MLSIVFSEISESWQAVKLNKKTEDFVVHFGEMGSRWGFNRTVGQMLALLVIHPEPLNADDMAEALHVSRGNVSMGLKELQSWRLVRVQRVAGDRKDYFTTAGSLWDMAQTVFEERRKREIEPTLTILRSSLLEEPETDQERYAHQQMSELLSLLEQLTNWAQQLNQLSPAQLQGLLKLGSGVSKVLELKDRIQGSAKSE